MSQTLGRGLNGGLIVHCSTFEILGGRTALRSFELRLHQGSEKEAAASELKRQNLNAVWPDGVNVPGKSVPRLLLLCTYRKGGLVLADSPRLPSCYRSPSG